MDSITQFALGSSIALATMGRRTATRTAAWKIALIGGMVGTLPDLDAFIDFGDAISNMTRHRAESHGIFYLTLATPLIGVLAAWLESRAIQIKRWCWAVWLIFMTHVGIDLLTIYGTQLAQPFSDHPFGVGSLFVIDPAYTLALITGIIGALIIKTHARWRWNLAGLTFSSGYILWSIAAHNHVTELARRSAPVGVEPHHVLVTASPLNTILWRAIAVTPDSYVEGWYSFFDAQPRFTWTAYPRDSALLQRHQEQPDVRRIAAFSHGFYNLQEIDGRLVVTDLRLGLEPFYSFRFDLGSVEQLAPARSQRIGARPELDKGLPWLWQRIQGNPQTLSDFKKNLLVSKN